MVIEMMMTIVVIIGNYRRNNDNPFSRSFNFKWEINTYKKYTKETKREISFFFITRIFSGVESFKK